MLDLKDAPKDGTPILIQLKHPFTRNAPTYFVVCSWVKDYFGYEHWQSSEYGAFDHTEDAIGWHELPPITDLTTGQEDE